MCCSPERNYVLLALLSASLGCRMAVYYGVEPKLLSPDNCQLPAEVSCRILSGLRSHQLRRLSLPLNILLGVRTQLFCAEGIQVLLTPFPVVCGFRPEG